MTTARFALVVLAALTASASSRALPPDDPGPGELLPDFDQRPPTEVSIRPAAVGSSTYWLTFTSRVENTGIGPLLLTGTRPSTAVPTMSLEQTVLSSDGSSLTSRIPGVMQYAEANHAHWHLLAFMRYELRNAGTNALVRPDRKTGFCIGDRYRSPVSVPSRPRNPVASDECARHHPEALRVTSGLSPGYGEIYTPIQDAQFIDVTGVAAGRYLLVHRTNADRSLRELEYRNNDASALVEIAYVGVVPSVTLLASCEDSARCASR